MRERRRETIENTVGGLLGLGLFSGLMALIALAALAIGTLEPSMTPIILTVAGVFIGVLCSLCIEAGDAAVRTISRYVRNWRN